MSAVERSALDFSAYIAERTRDFTGREWVFAAIDRWLAAPDAPRYFIITGEPGIGKTAIAARLTQFSDGSTMPPADYACVGNGFLSAVHFCSARSGGWISPDSFARSLSAQLAARYPAFADALASNPRIHIEQKAGTVSGTMIGAQITNYYAETSEALFNSLVRLPLQALFQQGEPSLEPLVILVDSLDEALSYSGRVSIVRLLATCSDLSLQVRLLLTTRPMERVLSQFRPLQPFVLYAQNEANQADLRAYIHRRLKQPYLQKRGGDQANRIATSLATRSKGNFLVITKVLDAVERGELSLDDPEALPAELQDLYVWFLDRLTQGDMKVWRGLYRPVIGTLAVAQEPVDAPTIRRWTGLTLERVTDALHDLQEFLSPKPEARYRLYHESMADFLTGDKAGHYFLDVMKYHRQVVDSCRGASTWDVVNWKQAGDYEKRHLVAHLYALQDVDSYRQDLYELVESQSWTAAKYVDTPWVDSLTQDLHLASAIAVDSGLGEWPRSLAYQLRRTLVEDLMSRLSDEAIVFMAKLGRIDRALHYAKRQLRQPFQLYHRIADVVAENEPGRALDVLIQSIRLFDQSSILNQYGARLVVAKMILENGEILAGVPVATQEARDLVRQAEEMQSRIPQSDKQSYQARYTCPILVLIGHLDEAKTVAESLLLADKSQALRCISLALPSGHPEKALLAKRALSILEQGERDAEIITREVQAIVSLLPHVDEEDQVRFIERLVLLEDELHSASQALARPYWPWVVENIADLDLERVKIILLNSKWNSSWRDTWPALIAKIALRDPEEALDIAESQYSNHVGYPSVLVDVIRTVAVQFGDIGKAEELIQRYSKQFSSSLGRIEDARLALAEAYLAQGNRQKAEEAFDEQVFVISDQGVRRGRNDLLVAMVTRSSVLQSGQVEAIFDRLTNVGKGRIYSSERLLGHLAVRRDRIDLIEAHRLDLEAKIGATYELASRDPDLAQDIGARWNLWNRMRNKREISRLKVAIRAAQARQDRSTLEELVLCFDGEGAPHHICANMRALPIALYQSIEKAKTSPDEVKQIVERVYPILLGWKCSEGKEDCECYADSERLLGHLIVIMAQLDRCRAMQMVASLPSQPSKVSTLKGIGCHTEFDDDLIEAIIELSQQTFSQPLDLAGSYLDLAANVLSPEKADWIARLVQLAEPLIDDRAWPRPSTKLKVNRARASMKLIDSPDQFAYVRDAVDDVGGSLKDKLCFLDVLAERAVCWSQEDRLTLLRQIWELATIKRVEDVEALVAFAVRVLESLVDDKEGMFWTLYDCVEWAYQELPSLEHA